MLCALAGGVGGAKLAHGLSRILPPEDLAIVVNIGDDFEHLGLHVSHDIDTVVYTLAGNAKLLLIYRRLANELRLFRRATLAQGNTLSVSTREHREIVDQIAAGKVAAAGRALYDHVMASRERMHRLYAASDKPAAARGSSLIGPHTSGTHAPSTVRGRAPPSVPGRGADRCGRVNAGEAGE